MSKSRRLKNYIEIEWNEGADDIVKQIKKYAQEFVEKKEEEETK